MDEGIPLEQISICKLEIRICYVIVERPRQCSRDKSLNLTAAQIGKFNAFDSRIP